MRHLRLGSVVTSLSFSWNNMFTLLFNMGLLMSTQLMGLMAYTDLTDMKMKIRSLNAHKLHEAKMINPVSLSIEQD